MTKNLSDMSREDLEVEFRLQRKKMLDAMSAFAHLIRALPGGEEVIAKLERPQPPNPGDGTTREAQVDYLKRNLSGELNAAPTLVGIAKEFTKQLEKQNLHQRTVAQVVDGVSDVLKPLHDTMRIANSIDQRLKAVLDYDDQQMARMRRPAYLKDKHWVTVADESIVRLAVRYVELPPSSAIGGEEMADTRLEDAYDELQAAVTFRKSVIAAEQTHEHSTRYGESTGAIVDRISKTVSDGVFYREGEMPLKPADPKTSGDE